jgi:GNAT superfamily N-acetyltransferase
MTRGTIRPVTDDDEGIARTIKPRYRRVVGEAAPELDQRLSDELDKVNAAATKGVAPARELTVQILDESGDLAAGMSGWTWGAAAGIGLTWVREQARGHGLGAELLAEFEAEARSRGCTHAFVTSFTFQAPGFYERHGYREIFRWEGVPTNDAADVHLRKDL